MSDFDYTIYIVVFFAILFFGTGFYLIDKWSSAQKNKRQGVWKADVDNAKAERLTSNSSPGGMDR